MINSHISPPTASAPSERVDSATAPTAGTGAAGDSVVVIAQQPLPKVGRMTVEQEDEETMRLQGGGECCRCLFCCPCIETLICLVTCGCVRPHIDCGC